jgi:hypothetical protein
MQTLFTLEQVNRITGFSLLAGFWEDMITGGKKVKGLQKIGIP